MMQFITVLVMCILVGSEVDLFIPSFPELQNVFNISTFMVELTLGVNLLAHCFTSLIVGILGDLYGRKPIILIGLIIFIAGSLFCVFAIEYWQLLFGRLLQGIGISGPAVLSYVVIADTYSTEKQQQMMGILNGSVTFAMAFAPVIGSYVSLFFHWRGNFVLLLILGLISLVLGILFIQQGQTKPYTSKCFKEYYVVFQSPKTFYYISTICLLVLPYWLFIGMAPILYIGDLGVTLYEFGFYQGATALMFSIISLSSGYCIKKFGQLNCFIFSISMLCTFIVFTLILIAFRVTNPVIITICMQFLALGIIYPVNILYPLSLESIAYAKGKIAAVIAASRLILIAFSIQTVSYTYQGTFAPIGITMCFILVVMFWCCYKLFRISRPI
jgi:DHA1 family bicyclomycin/chloramphenicol resistance-like MFS transporter